MTTKYLLPESEIPTHWYNVLADMAHRPDPPLHPATKQPIGPDALTPIFPSGHGHFDLAAYDAHLHGRLEDSEYPEGEVARALAGIAGLQP